MIFNFKVTAFKSVTFYNFESASHTNLIPNLFLIFFWVKEVIQTIINHVGATRDLQLQGQTGSFRIIKGHAFEGRDPEVEGHALLHRGWL